MQIGLSNQMNGLSLLRPASAGDGPGAALLTAGTATGATASVGGGWRHQHHGDGAARVDDGARGDDGGRLEGRLQRLSALLQRLTAQNPDAQDASYAALILGGSDGAVAIAATTPGAGQTAGDTLVIQAQTISDIFTGSGNDTVTLRGAVVSGIFTGGGSDRISISGNVVTGIHTDDSGPAVASVPVAADPVPVVPPDPVASGPVASGPVAPEGAADPVSAPVAVPEAQVDTSGAPLRGAGAQVSVGPGSGNDALSIAAFLINDIVTGGGNDALALLGKVVANVDAGAGDDAVAIQARIVTGIQGGDGNDAIAVDAGVGVAGLSNAASWFAAATADPLVATNGSASASVAATAQAGAAYADVDGGAGNDVISVRTRSVLAVAGGTGDDTINAVGGAISLVYGAGDGNDTVNVAEGAQVVLQLAPDTGSYSVEFGQDSMTVKLGSGSVTFKGIGAGTIGIKQGDGGMALITQPSANVGLNRAL